MNVTDWPKLDEGTGYLVSGQKLNQIRDAFVSLQRGDHIDAGPGIHAQRTKHNIILSATRKGGTGGTPSHPYKVLTQIKPSNANIIQAGVILNSRLYRGDSNDTLSITGLLSTATPAANDAGWFDLIATDLIWLGCVFNAAGEATDRLIDSWGQGDLFEINSAAWDTNAYVTHSGSDPYFHQATRKPIAYTLPGADGKPVVYQLMDEHQALFDASTFSLPSQVLRDRHEGYYIAP